MYKFSQMVANYGVPALLAWALIQGNIAYAGIYSDAARDANFTLIRTLDDSPATDFDLLSALYRWTDTLRNGGATGLAHNYREHIDALAALIK